MPDVCVPEKEGWLPKTRCGASARGWSDVRNHAGIEGASTTAPNLRRSPSWTVCRASSGPALHPARQAPDQNAYIERFNRSCRTEVLNAHLCELLAELRAVTDAWLGAFYRERPTKASARCRLSRSCRGDHQPVSLRSVCLLDRLTPDTLPGGDPSGGPEALANTRPLRRTSGRVRSSHVALV